MSTPLSNLAGKVDAVAPDLRGLFAKGISGATEWVEQAHALRLAVHGWTFRPEPQFAFSSLLPASHNSTEIVELQLQLLQQVEVDAVFIENPQDAASIWIHPEQHHAVESAQQSADLLAVTAWSLALLGAVMFFFVRKLRRDSKGFRPLEGLNV
jgi:hypothetical protein